LKDVNVVKYGTAIRFQLVRLFRQIGHHLRTKHTCISQMMHVGLNIVIEVGFLQANDIAVVSDQLFD